MPGAAPGAAEPSRPAVISAVTAPFIGGDTTAQKLLSMHAMSMTTVTGPSIAARVDVGTASSWTSPGEAGVMLRPAPGSAEPVAIGAIPAVPAEVITTRQQLFDERHGHDDRHRSVCAGAGRSRGGSRGNVCRSREAWAVLEKQTQPGTWLANGPDHLDLYSLTERAPARPHLDRFRPQGFQAFRGDQRPWQVRSLARAPPDLGGAGSRSA